MREGGEKSCFTRGSAAQIFLGDGLSFFSYPKLGFGWERGWEGKKVNFFFHILSWVWENVFLRGHM